MVLCWWWCVWWCCEDGVVCMVLQVLRLLRKTSLRCFKCCACHAKRGAHSQFASLVAGLPPTSRKVLEVLRLPRKTNPRCSECCASAVPATLKWAWGAPSAAPATQNQAAPIRNSHHWSANFRRPLWQVLQMLHLPRQSEAEVLHSHHSSPDFTPTSMEVPIRITGRQTSSTQNYAWGARKCCACHAKRTWGSPSAAPATPNGGGAHSHHSSPDFRRPLWRCSKGCACHAKTSLRCPECCASAAPATQNEPEVLQVLRLPLPNEAAPIRIARRQTSADLYDRCSRVLRLPCKTSLRCSKCCACHTKRTWGAPSAAPAMQNELEGVPSAAPATQNQAEVLQVACARGQTSKRPLWRCSKGCACHAKRCLRCSKCCACHAKRGGPHSHHSSPDFRRPLWRCSKCCACYAKTSLRCSKCCACHAKTSPRCPTSAAPATPYVRLSPLVYHSSP